MAGLRTQGTTFHVTDGGSPTTYIKCGKITNFTGPGGSATVIPASDLDSTAKEKMIGLADEGQFSFDLNFGPTDVGQTQLRNNRINQTRTECKITFYDGSIAHFFGYVLSFVVKGGVDAIVTASCVIEIDGQVEWS